MNPLHQEIDQYRQDLRFTTQIKQTRLEFITTWGLFSPRALDEGSRLLLENIKLEKQDKCLDVGCGYGPLGLYLAKHSENNIHMVDKDFVAVEYTHKNVELNHLKNCTTYLSNGFNQIKDNDFNLIVSNLPAKVGNELLSLYILDAYQHLQPNGRFYVVTITGMRKFIQRMFNDIFGNYKKVKQGKTYTVAMGQKI